MGQLKDLIGLKLQYFSSPYGQCTVKKLEEMVIKWGDKVLRQLNRRRIFA